MKKRKLTISIDEGMIRGLLLGAFVIIGILFAGGIVTAAGASTPKVNGAITQIGIQTVSVSISGMVCGSCVQRVTAALDKLPGIQSKQIQVGSAVVTYDTSSVSIEQIKTAIEAIGYKVTEVKAVETAAAPVVVPAQKPSGCGCGGSGSGGCGSKQANTTNKAGGCGCGG